MKALRAALVETFGPRKYWIRKDGMIGVYGTMPNTNQEGWYLLGHKDSAEVLNKLGI